MNLFFLFSFFFFLGLGFIHIVFALAWRVLLLYLEIKSIREKSEKKWMSIFCRLQKMDALSSSTTTLSSPMKM